MTEYVTTAMILRSRCKLTPMMAQYFSLKKERADAILLFRMGDFYESFFEDAMEISSLLNIVLSKRGHLGGWPVPMAGIPHHAASSYIDRITAAGKKVAVAEQVEDPKDAVGIVKRAISQVVSPGIPYDLDKAPGRGRHFIAAAEIKGGQCFLVAIDLTTGDFLGFVNLELEDFLEKLRLCAPKEIVAHRGQLAECREMELLIKEYNILATFVGEDCFDPKLSSMHLERLIPGHRGDRTLGENPALLAPLSALSYYICSTQKEGHFCHVRPFKVVDPEGILAVSLPTLVGLEILPAPGQEYGNCLLGFLDQTVGPLGSRKMRDLVVSPLGLGEDILARQELVAYFCEHPDELAHLRERLVCVGDVERRLAQISRRKITATGVLSLGLALKTYFQILRDFPKLPTDTLLPFSPEERDALRDIYREITHTLNDEVGASLSKGNLIRRGRDGERDRLADMLEDVSRRLQDLERRYGAETGIMKLKVAFNSVAGYYIEISKSQASKVPSHFKRRQTLTASERYTTEELSAFEKEMMVARDNLGPIERRLFEELVAKIVEHSALLLRLASNVAHLDAFSSLGLVALREKFVRPILSQEKEMDITGAWHPLIKASLQEAFVSHDVVLGPSRFFALITGPNMAGKTTVMREVALIQVLAQMGAFVPAIKARVGLADRLFSRLGAQDNILKGQSTFMVEMSEACEIVRHATDRSLILLDEIGRGTSTYDGLGLAWSLVEYLLAHIRARTLFATHYHELIDLVDSKEEALNLTVETQNKGGRVKFLYRLIEGPCRQSFGIHVAKMAGLPPEILSRAQVILKKLEEDRGQGHLVNGQVREASPAPELEHLRSLEEDIKGIDPLNITPLEALQKIHDLRSRLDTGV